MEIEQGKLIVLPSGMNVVEAKRNRHRTLDLPCSYEIKVLDCKQCGRKSLHVNYSAYLNGEQKTVGHPSVECLRCCKADAWAFSWKQWEEAEVLE